ADAELEPSLFGTLRMVELSQLALRDLERHLGEVLGGKPIPVLLGVPEPRPGFDVDDARELAEQLTPDEAEQRYRVETIPTGHAAALRAVEHAAERIRSGASELCIAGGVDSYLDPDTLEWLDGERRLAREGVRSGFPPGEAAAMLLLASPRARARLGLPALARVRGAASTQEARALDSETGSLGEGLSAAVRQATRSLSAGELVSDLYGDLNGERHRSEDWGFTALRCAHVLRDASQVHTAVGECGDVGAATGALHCVLAARAWQREYAQGARALLWAGSWSGARSVLLLEEGRA
ncbi:MAG TPA: beta-ketoacyl synthase N-terminal-like domain-containing protein, partial [Polyangiales bacterium]|nr:beta-ketoacyl synthase N-terminal-like domain-containing protein [Polyangiales bacterium]